MKSRLSFYFFVAVLVVFDAVLIRSPNLIGKIGLFVYQYHYLSTFPKTLLTISLVAGIALVLSEMIRLAVKKRWLQYSMGKLFLTLLFIASVVLAIKVGLDFSSGSYEHTGLRFRLGAYLLPVILVMIFLHAWLTLPKASVSSQESPSTNDDHQ